VSVSIEVCEILVIDFNNLLVRAWHAGKPTESHAVRSMFQTIAGAVRTLRPSRLVFAMDGGYHHRTAIYPAYKAHRPPSDPDLVRQRQLAIDAIKAAGLCMVHVDGYEADDVIASIAANEFGVVICSCDKDLLSLCGLARVYHPWGAGKFATAEDVLGVSPSQVSDYLALCGDKSDGVPGVPGVGPKTASELLSQYGNLEAILSAARTLRIPGAVGKNIASGISDALLSQQLVQLVDNLPLPELTYWYPRSGWQQRLTELRLGSVAAILDSLQQFLLLPRLGVDDGVAAVNPRRPKSLFDDGNDLDPVAESRDSGSVGDVAETSVTGPRWTIVETGDAVPRSSSAETSDASSSPVAASCDVPRAGVLANYELAGFTVLKQFDPVPGTQLKSKHLATWRDGSRWILDQNTRRHICCSDAPVTEWVMDRRGPVDPKTNAVRKAT
jgi:5'-3' exonuclease